MKNFASVVFYYVAFFPFSLYFVCIFIYYFHKKFRSQDVIGAVCSQPSSLAGAKVLMYRVFIKYCIFSHKMIFLNSDSSAAAPLSDLPSGGQSVKSAVHTH